jgi:phenylalanine ammonia-lyase
MNPLVEQSTVVVGAADLSVTDVTAVARSAVPVRMDEGATVTAAIDASRAAVQHAIAERRPVYGVNTRLGGLATHVLSEQEALDLQNNIVWLHKTGAGRPIPADEVRAGMLVRFASLARGYSGVRRKVLERFAVLLNAGITPLVREFGSIGASGDLVPLSYVAGALIGSTAGFEVELGGQVLDARTALAAVGLEPIKLEAKEGLALINGVSMSAGIAALCVADVQRLLRLALGAHALMIEGLAAGPEPFEPLQHQLRPHPGQLWVAEAMRTLLGGSRLMRPAGGYEEEARDGRLIQDRYSVRCLPQFLAPIVEGVSQVADTIEIELNSVSDNPIIDPRDGSWHHGGNFMGSAPALAMDRLRQLVGLTAKHLDVQAAQLMAPEFSGGLPASLVGSADGSSVGLKGLQISANSIVPYLTFLGAPVADRFPTHAEQFNQNINSQSWLAARLARDSVRAFEHFLAMMLLMAVQAVDLRASQRHGVCNPTPYLGRGSRSLYAAMRGVLGRPPSCDRPYAADDRGQCFDVDAELVVADIRVGTTLVDAMTSSVGDWRAPLLPHDGGRP